MSEKISMSNEVMERAESKGAAAGSRLSSRLRRWGFLRRQFQTEATLAQIIFDVTVGMILPILCLVFDPIVFRGGEFGPPMLESYRFFAYGLIAIEIVALGMWLGAGARAGEWCGVLGGVMLAGAFFSVGIGLILLPLSLLGLAFGIGVLGFTPFVTAVIYGRNARRALCAGRARMPRAALCVTLALGAAVPFGAPAFAQWRVRRMIERSLAEVIGGDETRARAAGRRLGLLSRLVEGEFDELARAYGRETDPARKQRLARAYRDITGGDIERRLLVLND
ncbi:MAG TPA: hypothetical protein VEY11_11590 [Pyrinomonadaceae bacterium]|nr:hypothetical protein [Pyrinomonadaceae bacterium]